MPPAKKKTAKRVTRYTHDDAKDPRTPETGHTGLLPEEETVVTVPMDSGWVEGMVTGKLPDDETTYVVDMDPSVDPVLLWSGKRSRRDVPVLPLQRNEIVTVSRISQIIERARRNAAKDEPVQGSFFADLEKDLRESDKSKRVEFYTHDEQWRNKLICGDSLPVMESMIRYEGLAGAVQMIYFDPPYGIKYDANFQQRLDTPKNVTNDCSDDVLTIKAFRDTWALGIHSYLSSLRDRLYLMRDLLSRSGSIFVQINQENSHLLRVLLDEVFGRENFRSLIAFTKTGGLSSSGLDGVFDLILWYARDTESSYYQQIYQRKEFGGPGTSGYTLLELADGSWRSMTAQEKSDPQRIPEGARIFDGTPLVSAGESKDGPQHFEYNGTRYKTPPNRHWSLTQEGLRRLAERSRILQIGKRIEFKKYFDEFPYLPLDNIWLGMGERGFTGGGLYAVQTDPRVIERCMLMTTRPGDLVFDPTCGSGSTALSAEKTGRRWVTCDTSRVSINVSRQRLLSATYPQHVLLGDSPSQGFRFETAGRSTPKTVAFDIEPETIDLVDQPLTDLGAVRIAGPFEIDTLGRYSVEDWKGHLVSGEQEAAKLENYVEVICRLYRPDAEVGGGTGLLHAVEDTEDGMVAISVGPLTGRVTAAQVHDAARETKELGATSLHVLGWAFEANVGEVKASLDGVVDVQPVMIRPDALAEGLKITQAEMLFSPLALPEVMVDKHAKRMYSVTLEGVGLFDRKTKETRYHPADDGYIQAWYLDEDYDGDCFVDCQMFFDFKKTPNLKSVAGVDVDGDEFAMQFTSDEFARGHYGRIAVKVVDVYGNESTVVKALP